MSSNPAIMRSSVDLPHPDGPTRIISSPSPMSRLTSLTALKPSPYSLNTFFTVIAAMPSAPLTLDGAVGQAGDDLFLEEKDQHNDRDGHHDCGGRDGARRLLEL